MSGPMTVLVTGGAGYVGSVLVPKLLDQGHRVKVLDLYFFGDHVLDAVKDNPRLQQIKGDPVLNFDPAKGDVKAPWLSWGPYLWAKDSKRGDGFSYQERDFSASDGTHESQPGQEKIGRALLGFFKTDTTAKVWFVGSNRR